MSPAYRRRLIIYLVIPIGVGLAAYLLTALPYTKYTRAGYELLAFLLVADLAAASAGAWRNAAIVAAATIFGLSAIEFACAAMEPGDAIYARNFSTSDPVLGWRSLVPGVYRSYKTSGAGQLIYSADYTIDNHLLRRTLSGTGGPGVAFFGDSLTFGQGLADADTLPQIYADLNGRKTVVLNLGFPGYGPQQMLRALETGLFDPLLAGTKIFIFETAAWHAERAACRPGFMARAPRYELRDGEPVFVGACGEGINQVFREVVLGSKTYHRLLEPIFDAARPQDVEIYVAELRRSAELAKQKYGARLIALYISESDRYLAPTGFTDAQIKNKLRQSGVEVVDATLDPRNFPPGTLFKIPGDGHPTAIANRARAQILENYLSEVKTTAR